MTRLYKLGCRPRRRALEARLAAAEGRLAIAEGRLAVLEGAPASGGNVAGPLTGPVPLPFFGGPKPVEWHSLEVMRNQEVIR